MSKSTLLTWIISLMNVMLTFGQVNSGQIDVQLFHQPERVTIDGKPFLYYELYIRKLTKDSIHLKEIRIIDLENSENQILIDQNQLKTKFARIPPTSGNPGDKVEPDLLGVIYFELNFPITKSRMLVNNQIAFETINGAVRKSHSFSIKTKFDFKNSNIVLGPPLRSGLWAAVYEPSWERGHRRVIYNVSGKDHIPGRFAIDFIKMNGLGRYADGEEDSIKNWFGYGEDVLAVADGIVSSTRNDFSESPTLSGHAKYSSDKSSGNYISINIGHNHFAFYEHLKPGSIKVKPGQKVKKGDVIGSLGYTGQTTGPHLHFHIANADSPLDAEGVEYSFEAFSVLGSYDDMAKFGKEPWSSSEQRNITKERPSPNSVIEF